MSHNHSRNSFPHHNGYERSHDSDNGPRANCDLREGIRASSSRGFGPDNLREGLRVNYSRGFEPDNLREGLRVNSGRDSGSDSLRGGPRADFSHGYRPDSLYGGPRGESRGFVPDGLYDGPRGDGRHGYMPEFSRGERSQPDSRDGFDRRSPNPREEERQQSRKRPSEDVKSNANKRRGNLKSEDQKPSNLDKTRRRQYWAAKTVFAAWFRHQLVQYNSQRDLNAQVSFDWNVLPWSLHIAYQDGMPSLRPGEIDTRKDDADFLRSLFNWAISSATLFSFWDENGVGYPSKELILKWVEETPREVLEPVQTTADQDTADTVPPILHEEAVNPQDVQSHVDETQADQTQADEVVPVRYILDFGKHEGTALSDVPASYLGYLLKHKAYKWNPSLKAAMVDLGCNLESDVDEKDTH